MSSFRKRGLIALAIGVTAALAVAIPAVIAGPLAGGGNGTPAAAASPSPAAVTSLSGCTLNRMGFASSDVVGGGTTSTTFVQVPGMSVPFDVPSKDTCVEIEFSTYSFTNGTELEMVRALVDNTVCQPGEVQLSGNDDENADGDWARSHSYTFECGVTFHNPFHPHHTASVEFRSFFGGAGGPVFAHKPTMSVRWGA